MFFSYGRGEVVAHWCKPCFSQNRSRRPTPQPLGAVDCSIAPIEQLRPLGAWSTVRELPALWPGREPTTKTLQRRPLASCWYLTNAVRSGLNYPRFIVYNLDLGYVSLLQDRNRSFRRWLGDPTDPEICDRTKTQLGSGNPRRQESQQATLTLLHNAMGQLEHGKRSWWLPRRTSSLGWRRRVRITLLVCCVISP